MEKVRPWCGQPSDRGRLRNRTEQGLYRQKSEKHKKEVESIAEACHNLLCYLPFRNCNYALGYLMSVLNCKLQQGQLLDADKRFCIGYQCNSQYTKTTYEVNYLKTNTQSQSRNYEALAQTSSTSLLAQITVQQESRNRPGQCQSDQESNETGRLIRQTLQIRNRDDRSYQLSNVWVSLLTDVRHWKSVLMTAADQRPKR